MLRCITKRALQLSPQSCHSSFVCLQLNSNQYHSQQRCKSHYNRTNDENRDNDERASKHTYHQCPYHLLKGKFIETIGFLGAAIVVGLNVETRFCGRSKWTHEISHGHSKCYDYRLCCSFLDRIIAFASPKKHRIHNYALPQSHDEFSNASAEEKKGSDIKAIDAIEEICDQLQCASIEYIDHLNNMMGVALIDSDPKEAVKCWSSCNNYAKAMFNLAVAYETGKHSNEKKVDLDRAFHYYKIAAEKGHKFAIYNLALFYLKGRGVVDIDTQSAKSLLQKAAKLGVKQAQDYIDYDQKRDAINGMVSHSDTRVMRISSSVPNLPLFGNLFSNQHSKTDDKLYDEKTNVTINDSINNSAIASSLHTLSYFH